jgi:hypothetical protein
MARWEAARMRLAWRLLCPLVAEGYHKLVGITE